MALQTNTELLQLPDKFEASDSAAILAQVSTDLNSPAESTRLEALHWVSTLLHRIQAIPVVVVVVSACHMLYQQCCSMIGYKQFVCFCICEHRQVCLKYSLQETGKHAYRGV